MNKTVNQRLSPRKKKKKNNKGIALLIAIFSLGLLAFFDMEVSYETKVEYIVASQKINRLRSYYAAKAGVELSLLRILLYKKAIAQYGEQLGENKSMLDPIWNFPFAWPPSKFIPKEDVTTVTYETIKAVEKESLMDATYITQIETEGGKIDINDLGSDIKSLRESTKQQLLKIFKLEIENNEKFQEKWRNTDFNELINNITDWIDEDEESLNGGNEKQFYQEFIKEYKAEEVIPPNKPFKTIEELHMVAGMKDDFYTLLKNRITVFGVKGINVNFADKDMLKSLDEQIDDEVVKEILKRRSSPELGGPFKNEEDFETFLDTFINVEKFNEGGIPLFFDNPYNFRIVSIGEFAKATSEITVVTYDVENLVGRLADYLDKQDEENTKDSGEEQNQEQDKEKEDKNANNEQTNQQDKKNDKSKEKKPIPSGRPRIVLWQEK
ncbi:MAG: general secretion pathway protein GspK [Bdellovibrionales bacterium]|nr:general secretion pathway protein GspK [Bdellovibrionales bacterium]